MGKNRAKNRSKTCAHGVKTNQKCSECKKALGLVVHSHEIKSVDLLSTFPEEPHLTAQKKFKDVLLAACMTAEREHAFAPGTMAHMAMMNAVVMGRPDAPIFTRVDEAKKLKK